METTRNAVLGRAYRLGVSRFDRSELTLQNTRKARHNQTRRQPAPARSLPPLPPPPVLPVRGEAKSLLALNRWECRNPVGETVGEDTLFCAAPTIPGRIYCAACQALLWIPLSARDKKELQRVAAL